MSEGDVVKTSEGLPPTVESLTDDFISLGLKPGMVLFMNSSLASIGWVVGGAQAVIMALRNVLTDTGTIVVPTFTSSNGEPREWKAPPVPEEWWQIIRDKQPAYDPDMSPSREMGIIAESIRKLPGAHRSSHPQHSFAAWGPKAEEITSSQPLSNCFGEGSPLSKVYDLDGHVLLLGVAHKNNTTMHLAELRAKFPEQKYIPRAAAMLVDGKREWVEFTDIEYNDDLFPEIGKDFENESPNARIGMVGHAECGLYPQRELVDFTIDWLENRMPARIKPYDT